MTKYIEFQLPLAFIKECMKFPVFIATAPIDLSPYNNHTIETVVNQPTAVVDIGRVRFRFGDDEEGMVYGQEDKLVMPEVIINGICKASEKDKVNLSRSEARAILAYYSSIGGEYQQGGIFRVAEILYSLIFNSINQGVGEKKTLGLRIKRIDENLELTFQEEIYRFSNTVEKGKWHIKKDPLFKTTSSYLMTHRLTDKDSLYKIFPLEKSDNRLIAENVWLDMVSVVLLKLEKKRKFSFEELLLIPFISDQTVRDLFCKKLALQTDEIKTQAVRLIEACFTNDMVIKNTILSRPEVEDINAQPPITLKAKTKEVSFQVEEKKEKVVINIALLKTYQDELAELTNIVQNRTYDKTLRGYADSVLQAVKGLTENERKQNMLLLTEVLQRTTIAITQPDNADNLKQFEALIKPLANRNFIKLVAAVTLVVAGAAIVSLVTGLAASAIAAPTLLTMGLIGLGMNIAVGGFALIASMQLNQVSSSTTPFWRPKKISQIKAPPILEQKLQPR
jgi:hypothetical protein